MAKRGLMEQDLSKLDVTKLHPLSPEVISRQATINIGNSSTALSFCSSLCRSCRFCRWILAFCPDYSVVSFFLVKGGSMCSLSNQAYILRKVSFRAFSVNFLIFFFLAHFCCKKILRATKSWLKLSVVRFFSFTMDTRWMLL
jgi:hypothetical protein